MPRATGLPATSSAGSREDSGGGTVGRGKGMTFAKSKRENITKKDSQI